VCGIAGFIDPKLSGSKAADVLASMLESIAHRGPDARDTWSEGAVSLGHNRLSIIDLSADGTQPMRGFGSVIVFNGEVYNYIELRRELQAAGYVFVTATDTEVVLASYRHYGIDCVKKFVGMWAFALWDLAEKTLFCSRDRFGIKPFHYIEKNGAFHFASEYKALRCSPHFTADLNVAQALRGVQLGWNTYHDETYYSAIRSLPAAGNLVWKEGKCRIDRYWDVDTSKVLQGDEADLVSGFRQKFDESIRLHMRSDVEVGGCLSGGLDSSAIASSVAAAYPDTRFKTFTVYYDAPGGVDERPWVKEVLNRYPALQPYYFQPSEDDIADSFEHAIYHADVPLAGSSPISQYFVMRLAAQQGIKVLLDGQGSDEFLGGYMHSFYRLIGDRLSHLRVADAISEWRAHATTQSFAAQKSIDVLLKSGMAGLMSEQQLYSLEYRHFYSNLAFSREIPFKLESRSGSRLNGFLYHLLTTTSLPTLLQFEDRNSMAFSIESRVPFLDHRLVEYAFGLPDRLKIRRGQTKKVLRDSLRGTLPDAIANRSDKKGFVTPGEVKWLRGPLRFLLETDFSNLDFIRQPLALKELDEFKKGNDRSANLIWRLVVLDYWCRKYT
jgi:asparagine synthase (glutamine-hydrolysing)